MKQQYIYTCEEINTSSACRSRSGTKLYTIKGACQNQVDQKNARYARDGKPPLYELVTYALTRVQSEEL